MSAAKIFRTVWNIWCLALCWSLFSGCATPSNISQNDHPFSFDRDTMDYANELKLEYFYDADGKWRSKPREPAPHYSLHCFVVARSARQFFLHAQFDFAQPKVTLKEYQRLAHVVLHRSASEASRLTNRVVIPGYASLRDFSHDYEQLLKKESGGAWHSYVQRGHWRMLLPFSSAGQEKMAEGLLSKIRNNGAPIVHLVCFPRLTINHASILYEATETPEVIRFSMYDPNSPGKPTTLTFDRRTKRFTLPTNYYFPGGRVNVYEVYKSFWL